MAEWSTSCPDWQDRILSRRSLIRFAPLVQSEADAALSILLHELQLVDVAGAPTVGQASRPWLVEFAASIFGAYNPETGRRLISEFFLLISKKNSKSTIAAAIMLTALVRNWRRSAEYLILAPTVEIADNSFKPAADMIRASKRLAAMLHIQDHYRTITHKTMGATLKVVAADNEAVGGKKATGVLVDELWQFGKRVNADGMFREATGGLASRPEGFVIYLSSQSDTPPAGVFKQKLDYARGVRDGTIIDNQFLPILYEYPPAMLRDEAYNDPSTWWITNPNLGASVDREFLIREHMKAGEAGADALVGFFAKHVNVEIGLRLGSDRWRGADSWLAAGDRSLDLAALLRRCEVIVAGIDGGGLDDLLGLCLMGREIGTRRWLCWHRTWCHRSVLWLRKSEAARLLDFERDGDLVIIDDMLRAFADLAVIVQEVEATGLLDKVGMDPMGVGLIVEAMAEAGVDRNRIVAVPQGWKLNGAIKAAEVKLESGELLHAAQPIVAWAVSNAKVEPKGNAVTITKQASGTAKIDPLMALFDCAACLTAHPQAPSLTESDVRFF